ncbi:uncharacterized protein LOC129597860 isoform X2 [Paramacrobiotus metropolitanus]|uniref:uncharacterized protein LOC129597860 isoform X2 n=1 Tax=Paramacrobiotus metropolitanus TaxID=2943436 RepID=UPI002445BCE4|nr:uncharacterized protein LOC129597860 isoform X2 [Paramacrobiotus metropolitanus]
MSEDAIEISSDEDASAPKTSSGKKRLHSFSEKVYKREDVVSGLDGGTLSKVQATGASRRSQVWEHFMEIHEVGSGDILPYVYCVSCKEVFKHISRNGTSHLSSHIRDSCRPVVVKSQPKITSFVQSGKAPVVSVTAKTMVTESCVRFVAEDMRSFESVKGNGFIRLIQTAIDIGDQYGKVSAAELLPHPTTVSRNVESTAKKRIPATACIIWE